MEDGWKDISVNNGTLVPHKNAFVGAVDNKVYIIGGHGEFVEYNVVTSGLIHHWKLNEDTDAN